MSETELDPRLAADTYRLGHYGDTAVLLSRNAHYPWLILVPATAQTEFHRLAPALQAALMRQAGELARAIESWQAVDKVNIATIGNVVSQLHLHVVGRRRDDPAWPAVVWGHAAFEAYAPERLRALHAHLRESLGADFHACELAPQG